MPISQPHLISSVCRYVFKTFQLQTALKYDYIFQLGTTSNKDANEFWRRRLFHVKHLFDIHTMLLVKKCFPHRCTQLLNYFLVEKDSVIVSCL